MPLLHITLFLAVAIGFGNAVSAQATFSESDRVAQAMRIPMGATVRISQGGIRVEGEIDELATSLMRLRTWDGEISQFQIAELDSLWVRGRGTGTGALVGLGMGLLPVLLTCGEALDECGLVPNGLVIIGVSSLAGAAVGSLIQTWQRKWP